MAGGPLGGRTARARAASVSEASVGMGIGPLYACGESIVGPSKGVGMAGAALAAAEPTAAALAAVAVAG